MVCLTAIEKKTDTDSPSDRKFPHCLVCEKTSQNCSYPPGPSKPGPKIGSLRRRKCSLNDNANDDGDEERHTARPRLEPENETTAPVPVSPNSTSTAERGVSLLVESETLDVPATVEAKVPDLSFILHPSHESPGLNKEETSEQQSGNIQQKALLDKACSALGLRWTDVEEL